MLHCVVHLYYVPGSEKRDILRCACFKDMYGMEHLNKKVGCLQRRRYKCRYGRPKQSPDLEGSRAVPSYGAGEATAPPENLTSLHSLTDLPLL